MGIADLHHALKRHRLVFLFYARAFRLSQNGRECTDDASIYSTLGVDVPAEVVPTSSEDLFPLEDRLENLLDEQNQRFSDPPTTEHEPTSTWRDPWGAAPEPLELHYPDHPTSPPFVGWTVSLGGGRALQASAAGILQILGAVSHKSCRMVDPNALHALDRIIMPPDIGKERSRQWADGMEIPWSFPNDILAEKIERLHRAVLKDKGASAGIGSGTQVVETDPERSELTDCCKSAYDMHTEAVRMYPDLANATDKQVYEWLVNHGIDGYKMHWSFETWSRYVRKARNDLNQSKHSPRAGRAKGPSIVRPDEI